MNEHPTECTRCGAESLALSTLDQTPVCGACFKLELGDTPLDVLLVEDNEAFALAIERSFRGVGWQVRRVASATSALDQLRAREPDVLLLADRELAAAEAEVLAERVARLHPAVRRVVYSSVDSLDELIAAVAA